MSGSRYDKYLVRAPLDSTSPGVILMNNEVVPGCNVFIMYNWVREKPKPNPMHAAVETHDYDEIIVNIGTDPSRPGYLGGEIEGYMGGEKQIITTSSALFIPRNVEHGRVSWKGFERPHIQMAIKLSGDVKFGPPPKEE